MVFWVVLSCGEISKETGEDLVEEVDGNRFTQSEVDSLGEPVDSMCRGLVLPNHDYQNCEFTGPYQGMLQGEVLSDEVEMDEALQLCADDPNCSGITTEWYIGTPFKAIKKTADFVIDESSYGCTFVAVCSD